MKDPLFFDWAQLQPVLGQLELREPGSGAASDFRTLRSHQLIGSRIPPAGVGSELPDLRQDFPSEQLYLVHHFLMADARLLETEVHDPDAALVVELL